MNKVTIDQDLAYLEQLTKKYIQPRRQLRRYSLAISVVSLMITLLSFAFTVNAVSQMKAMRGQIKTLEVTYKQHVSKRGQFGRNKRL